ncbi:MAG: hypothetical protein K2X32_08890 [Phycisphaerales bacterium]|nr:hypothetical protein [Phycisphaerales bacterium]
MTPDDNTLPYLTTAVAWQRHSIGAVVCVGPAILLVSCLAKLADWDAHHALVAGLLNRTDRFAELFASLIVVIEFLPTALLLARLPRAANLWSLAFFITATIAWISASRSISKPTCSCFGQWSQYTLIVEGVAGVAIRNGVFIALTLIGLWFCWRKQPA